MNNTCNVCKATIDLQWSALQNEIKEKYNNASADRRTLSFRTAFIGRCIYCYKDFLERTEKDEELWYQEVMRVSSKRFGW